MADKNNLHRKVQCWIFSRSEKCLLLFTNKARGEFWQPVTGTVEANENFFEGACRESWEETRFRFKHEPVDIDYEFRFRSRRGQAVERVFALVLDSEETPVLDPNEHQAYEWTFPASALKKLKYPSNKEGLKRSFRIIFGRSIDSKAN